VLADEGLVAKAICAHRCKVEMDVQVKISRRVSLERGLNQVESGRRQSISGRQGGVEG
jgi:hypothetical protein